MTDEVLAGELAAGAGLTRTTVQRIRCAPGEEGVVCAQAASGILVRVRDEIQIAVQRA